MAAARTVTSNLPEGVNDDTGRPITPPCTAAYLCDCKIHVILRGDQHDDLVRRVGAAESVELEFSIDNRFFRGPVPPAGGGRRAVLLNAGAGYA